MDHLGKITTGLRKGRKGFEIPLGKKGLLKQQIGTDEERVSGKGRNAAIGRISVNRVGRVQRQDLPVTLLCLGKKIGEFVGPWSHVSDAIRRRK
jgi:hypothetical protein